MADRAKKISELNAHINPGANNLLVIVNNPGAANAETMKITLSNFFANVSCNVAFTGNSMVLPNTSVPGTITSAGVKGEIRFDSNHIYICIANNSWKRASLSTW